jgi:hypothetical protein
LKSIRKLYFQNAAGQRKGLNGDNGVYATNLSGFGVTLAPSYADLSRGFFSPVSSETEPQNTLAFTMMFTRNAYDVYQSFLNWLSASETITIVYNPTGQQEYFRDVSINFLQKGELTEVGWLEIPCSFFCCTPWYLPTPTTLRLNNTAGSRRKRYDYRYAPDLRYGLDSTAALAGTIAGGGHVPGALELTYYGAITNPQIRLTGNLTGKTYGICRVAVVLNPGDVLKISTRYENSYVKRITAAGVETDLLDELDLSTEPFFHIPVNEPCTVSVEADSAFSGNADLTVYYYYRSV